MKAGRVMALYGARWVQLYAGRVEITFFEVWPYTGRDGSTLCGGG